MKNKKKIFEPLPDDELEEIKKQGIPIGIFSSGKSCIVNNISEKKYIKIKKVKHKLNNQSFKFPIINPEYILVKDCFNSDIHIDSKYWNTDFERYPAKDVASVMAEMSKLATNDNKKTFKTDYLKKYSDFKKGKKQKEIDFAKLHEQRTCKLFPDGVVDDFQNAFDELQKAIKDFPKFSPIKDIADIDNKINKSGNYKIDRNRRKINKKKGYKRRKI